jgi:cellulose synthase/poly-beta-1,6-N-acetylglucosamine synthase-like glycosyltransferase
MDNPMRLPIPERPRVTLIIPCRNEAGFIATCLASVDRLEWPKDQLEVFVCDGMSTDGTSDVVRVFASSHPYVHLLENPKRSLASGWNLGLSRSTAEIVCMLIAHQTYEPDYVSTSIRYLREHDADAVGGGMRTLPQEDTALGRAISAVWSHPFGVGNAYFRIGTQRPRWVDNIHCGVFRRDAIDRIGGYDERLTRSQDADMQSRLRAAGGRLLLVPETFSAYYTRSAFGPFARYALINGYWVARPLEHGSFLRALRHWIPFLFVVAVVGLLILGSWWSAAWLLLALILVAYVFAAVVASIEIAIRRRGARYALLLPAVFVTLHLGYGLGTAAAFVELALGRIRRVLRSERRSDARPGL